MSPGEAASLMDAAAARLGPGLGLRVPQRGAAAKAHAHSESESATASASSSPPSETTLPISGSTTTTGRPGCRRRLICAPGLRWARASWAVDKRLSIPTGALHAGAGAGAGLDEAWS